MFSQGEIYKRTDIHALYNGQRQGGISTPAKHKVIFIFTGDTGEQYGYRDGWTDSGNFLYTGEGQFGDMTFRAGNLAIRDHLETGKELHMFKSEKNKSGYVRYIGQMKCIGFKFRQGPDFDNKIRKTIVFELSPINFKV